MDYVITIDSLPLARRIANFVPYCNYDNLVLFYRHSITLHTIGNRCFVMTIFHLVITTFHLFLKYSVHGSLPTCNGISKTYLQQAMEFGL
jgi:hypothetical protein